MGAKALRYDIRRDIIKCRALCICFKRLLVVDLEAAFMRIIQIIQTRNPALHIAWNAGLFWKKAATTYSPAGRSTIGADGLNFSVRNGKRWSPVTIAT